jgi:hypothetical protein
MPLKCSSTLWSHRLVVRRTLSGLALALVGIGLGSLLLPPSPRSETSTFEADGHTFTVTLTRVDVPPCDHAGCLDFDRLYRSLAAPAHP